MLDAVRHSTHSGSNSTQAVIDQSHQAQQVLPVDPVLLLCGRKICRGQEQADVSDTYDGKDARSRPVAAVAELHIPCVEGQLVDVNGPADRDDAGLLGVLLDVVHHLLQDVRPDAGAVLWRYCDARLPTMRLVSQTL